MKKVTEKAPSGDSIQKMGEMIGDTYCQRRNDRRDLEEHWEEIDRQVAMVAKPSNIDQQSGRAVPGSEWMPFIELPWQAQTLELMGADARRMWFPSERKWFSAIAHDSDKALMDLEEGLHDQGFTGNVNSSSLNAVVEACHTHFESLYDFRGEVDKLNLSAFKYGTFAGRMRPNRIRTYSPDYRTTAQEKSKVPVLSCFPIANTYLDDTPAAAQRAGVNISPAEIFTWHQRWEDLVIAAKRGGTDPMEDSGGWIPGMLDGLTPDPKTKQVQLLEWEGDLLLEMTDDETRFVPKAIVTVVLANKDKKPVERVIRFRRTSLPSYITHPYHQDDPNSRYGSSPLMKGMPIQLAASEMFSRMVQAGILNVEPPVSWRPISTQFAINGGPVIAPRELWEDPSGNSIKVHQIGDANALMGAWMQLKAEYNDVTGTSAPRLGQQTKSHQTAFAVDSELQRGGVRLVDYVRSAQDSPARTLLHLEYAYIKKALARKTAIYVPEFKQWLEISAKMLPDAVIYDILGAATPLEERGRIASKGAAINMLAQLEPLAVQGGAEPLNWDEIRKEIAKDGGLESDIVRQPEGGALTPAGQSGLSPIGDGDTGDPFIGLAAGTPRAA